MSHEADFPGPETKEGAGLFRPGPLKDTAALSGCADSDMETTG